MTTSIIGEEGKGRLAEGEYKQSTAIHMNKKCNETPLFCMLTKNNN